MFLYCLRRLSETFVSLRRTEQNSNLVTPVRLIARNTTQCGNILLRKAVGSVSTRIHGCTEGTSSPMSCKELS
jgi:hypothetical protein